jgi:hypothetical protein
MVLSMGFLVIFLLNLLVMFFSRFSAEEFKAVDSALEQLYLADLPYFTE